MTFDILSQYHPTLLYSVMLSVHEKVTGKALFMHMAIIPNSFVSINLTLLNDSYKCVGLLQNTFWSEQLGVGA